MDDGELSVMMSGGITKQMWPVSRWGSPGRLLGQGSMEVVELAPKPFGWMMLHALEAKQDSSTAVTEVWESLTVFTLKILISVALV